MTTTISMLAIGAWPGTPIEGLVLTSSRRRPGRSMPPTARDAGRQAEHARRAHLSLRRRQMPDRVDGGCRSALPVAGPVRPAARHRDPGAAGPAGDHLAFAAWTRRGRRQIGSHMARIGRAIACIRKSFTDQLNVRQLAHVAGMSSYNLPTATSRRPRR